MKLYEITGKYMDVMRDLEEQDVPQEVIESILAEISTEWQDKARNVGAMVLTLEAQANAQKDAAAAIADRAKATKTHADSLRGYLFAQMKAVDAEAFATDEFTVKFRKNPASLVIDEEELVPEDYVEIIETRKIDKNAIKADLKKLESPVTWAHLESTERLEIK